jgi:hypothetical protein
MFIVATQWKRTPNSLLAFHSVPMGIFRLIDPGECRPVELTGTPGEDCLVGF